MSARPLSESEYSRMVEFLTTEVRLRDRLLLILGCATGYRITELLSLTVGQVWDGTHPRKEVVIARRNLKGGAGAYCRTVRSRRVPLNERAREAVALYLGSLKALPGADVALFPTSRSHNSAMNRASAFRMLVGVAEACGLDTDRISTYTLRKTFVSRSYLISGCDLIKTQRMVGHSLPLITARYLETDQGELDDLVRSMAA